MATTCISGFFSALVKSLMGDKRMNSTTFYYASDENEILKLGESHRWLTIKYVFIYIQYKIHNIYIKLCLPYSTFDVILLYLVFNLIFSLLFLAWFSLQYCVCLPWSFPISPIEDRKQIGNHSDKVSKAYSKFYKNKEWCLTPCQTFTSQGVQWI